MVGKWNTGMQQETSPEYRYPFIEPASSYSPPPSSAAWRSQSGRVPAYDYIIVGGGTAGCPLAATLSRNFTVLLLERGGTPFANSNVSFLENFHINLADTSATSASQMFISTDGVFNSRARVLGGGSSINAGFYTRADERYDVVFIPLLPLFFRYPYILFHYISMWIFFFYFHIIF